jgi:hypothetical protein
MICFVIFKRVFDPCTLSLLSILSLLNSVNITNTSCIYLSNSHPIFPYYEPVLKIANILTHKCLSTPVIPKNICSKKSCIYVPKCLTQTQLHYHQKLDILHASTTSRGPCGWIHNICICLHAFTVYEDNSTTMNYLAQCAYSNVLCL